MPRECHGLIIYKTHRFQRLFALMAVSFYLIEFAIEFPSEYLLVRFHVKM